MKTLLKPSLAKIFQKAHVLFAYQFGSTITGGANAQSDVDIAVFLDPELSVKQRFNLRMDLMGALENFYKKTADVVVLNDIRSLFFKFTIVQEGKLIYCRSDLAHAEFECRIMSLYFDFKPFLEEYNKAYVKRSLQ